MPTISRNILISLVLIISLGAFAWSYFMPQAANKIENDPSQTLGQTVAASAEPSLPPPLPSINPSPSASPSGKPAPTPKPRPKKDSYIIAAYGDSMVDTMGENLDYLDKSLAARYPETKFKFYNYGIGSQNAKEGNARFDVPFKYKTRDYPRINEIKADVIIISSFAYNPLSPYDKNAYIEALKDLIQKSKNTGAKVYLFTEIAPLKTGFGEGVGGVNWEEAKVKEHVGYILQNLDATVALSSQTNTPLINAYKASQTDGKYGNRIYVATHDGIHPSIEGEEFMAEMIAETIILP